LVVCRPCHEPWLLLLLLLWLRLLFLLLFLLLLLGRQLKHWCIIVIAHSGSSSGHSAALVSRNALVGCMPLRQ
jgi:hypothetical protein